MWCSVALTVSTTVVRVVLPSITVVVLVLVRFVVTMTITAISFSYTIILAESIKCSHTLRVTLAEVGDFECCTPSGEVYVPRVPDLSEQSWVEGREVSIPIAA
jgi:hypothetical protein